MARITEVAEGIYQIHPELDFMFSLSYLVLGDRSALIEPGSTTQAQIILRAMETDLGFDPASLSYIIPTHIHMDHGGGTGYMARNLPQAQVVVYARGTQLMVDPTKIIAATKKAFGEDFEDQFGPILPVPEIQLLPVQGGDRIDLGGRDLEIIYTPGHAHHHISLSDNKSNGLFCGDALGLYDPNTDTVVTICPDGFDFDTACETIKTLQKLAPSVLFYSHNAAGWDTDKLMQDATEGLTISKDIVFAALRAGEDSEQIAHRLEKHFDNKAGTKLDIGRIYFDLTVAGYRGYFKRKGLI